MKDIKDVCFVIQSRVNSERVPKKVIKDFAGTTLVDIALNKLVKSSLIPNNQIYFSVYDKELIDIGKKYPINIFDRSYESANCDTGLTTLFEWHNKLPFKYVVLVHVCTPFLKIETIENFVKKYLSIKEGLFGVIAKKNYFWDTEGRMLNRWPEGEDLINTKAVEVTYEAAHCLYGSKLDSIKEGTFTGSFQRKNDPVLFPIDESESLDIDYNWQFEAYKEIYKNVRNN